MPSSQASFNSSLSNHSILGKLTKYELKRKFYEKLEDFNHRVLLYKEPGFVVYRAKCAYSGGVVVLKGYARQALTLQTQQRIWSEVNTLQNAHCPFILKCFDSFEDQGWWFLVLENCAAGDLYRIMQAHGRISSEGWLVSQVLLPLLQTLAYLHNEGIIHRDVKPEHVLFNSEKVAKLSGFFLAQDVTKFGYPRDMVGNLDYVAPEVFRLNTPEHKELAKTGMVSSTYDFKVDIWMMGILTYDVLVGVPPFNADSPNTCVQRVLLEDPVFPDEVSDEAADFILCCLTKDPTQRPTAKQLLTHPWVRTHITWVPPMDFEDPVPDMDFEYYELDERLGGEIGAKGDDSDEEEESGRVWYNPATWFKKDKVNEDQELPSTHEGAVRGQASMTALTFVQKLLGEGKVKTTADDHPSADKDTIPTAPFSSTGGSFTQHSGGSRSHGAPSSRGGLTSSQRPPSIGRNRVAPSTPPMNHHQATLEGGGDSMGSGGGGGLTPRRPDEELTPRSDRISDDGEMAAPVMQRISEAKKHVPSVSAVPPVGISGAVVKPAAGAAPPLTGIATMGLPQQHANGIANGGMPMAAPPLPPALHAVVPQLPLPQHVAGGAAGAAGSQGGTTPRSARSARLDPLPHPPPLPPPPAGVPLMVPLLPLSQLAATLPAVAHDDVLKLSAREQTSALYSARLPDPNAAPPESPAVAPTRSISHTLDTLAPPERTLAELAPPGYDASRAAAALPLSTLSELAPPGYESEARLPEATSPDRPNLNPTPSGRFNALSLLDMQVPTVLSRPASRMTQSRSDSHLPGDKVPVPPAAIKPPTPDPGLPQRSPLEESVGSKSLEALAEEPSVHDPEAGGP